MLYLIFTTVSFAITLIFIKLAATKIHPFASSLLFPAFAAIIQLIFLLTAKYRGTHIYVTKQGLVITAIGGLFLGLYTIFLYLSLSRMPISKVSPVVYVGAVALATLFGVLFLKESINWINVVGVLLAFGGLFLVFVR